MNLTVGKGLGVRGTGVEETVLVGAPHVAESCGRCVELGIVGNTAIGSQLKQTPDIEEEGPIVVLQLLAQLLHPCDEVGLCRQ